MHLSDLLSELETDVPAVNAASPLRLLSIGKYLDLSEEHNVIDFGCGRGEMLCLWAKYFGVKGTGIDISQVLLKDALSRVNHWDLNDQLEFICKDVKEYNLNGQTFDIAACMSASMGFGGYEPTIQYLETLIKTGGCITIAEPFYTSAEVPGALTAYEGEYHTEAELFSIARKHGLEVGYYSRATRDEWDKYIFNSRKAELRQFLATPPGPDRDKRKQAWHRWQDMYLQYRQHWQGMAFMTLHPA